MAQKNLDSGKARDIRPPYKWKAPDAPITAAGHDPPGASPQGEGPVHRRERPAHREGGPGHARAH
eukprot:CAMPEP_0175317870 /NCGR_PEP_ID=MMETSP0093-20121207/70144_1 /TAXON_ID=311494 /ORGANISM="Alexandrium monilatum, Strain CCMP3105" /LENGTH=64 /DNA_ID=CAMNT_0016614665 /DNA_START=1 /DNA_END=192 /DNA_ORIENTATION=-